MSPSEWPVITLAAYQDSLAELARQEEGCSMMLRLCKARAKIAHALGAVDVAIINSSQNLEVAKRLADVKEHLTDALSKFPLEIRK